MHSGMIGKVEKAHRYSEQRDRFSVTECAVSVRGDNDEHVVTLRDGAWACGCEFFHHNATCAHSMALELILEGMLPSTPRRQVA